MTDPDDLEHQGAIDWAHSIQARYAEALMGRIARDWTATGADPVYLGRLREMALESGLPEELVDQMFKRDTLEKISEFDEPDVRATTSALVEILVKTMADAGMSTGGRRLMVSSLASGHVNALCAANSWDEKHYHVFVDADLTVFCHSLAKLFGESLTRDNPVQGEASLDPQHIARNIRSPDLQKRAADLFCSTVLRGTPRASEPWAPSARALPLTGLLSSATNMFPIAHELGHLHLGHLEAEQTRHANVEGIGDLAATVYSHEAEYQADSVGSVITLQSAIRLGVANIFTALAPYIFLKGVEVLDACHEVFGERGAMNFTHPSATERARKTRQVIARHLEYHGTGAAFPAALRAVDIIAHWILFAAVTNLNRLKAEGRTPRDRVRLRVVENDGGVSILGLFPSSGGVASGLTPLP